MCFIYININYFAFRNRQQVNLNVQITREEFEAGEYRHFLEDLNRQELGMSGAKESLINMLDDIKGIERFENNFASLPESKRNALQELTDESLSHLLINKDKNKLLTKE